jgi:hypothetical protein
MTLVAFVSGRSPGLTTTVHALALTWPSPRTALVAELDPDGGCLAVRHEIPAEPGLTTLAAAGRRGLTAEVILRHCQRLADGTAVLLGPVAPDRAAPALSVLGTRLASALDAMPGVDVLADCGRIDSRSPALDVVHAARYVVVVVTPTLEGVAHVQARVESLRLPPGRVALVSIGQRPYPPDEVAAALGLPLLGALADDRKGADDLAGSRLTRRSELWRSAAALGGQLAPHLTPPVPPAPGPVQATSSGVPETTVTPPDTFSQRP